MNRLTVFIFILLSFTLSVFGQQAQQDKHSNMKKILTVFFSMKGETIAPGMKIVNLQKGHTNVFAEFIQKSVGGELFEIETTKVYSKDHFKMIEEAKLEMESGEKVQPKKWLNSVSDYDVIFVGYPIWWGTYPPIINTFLEHYNLNGKTIIPFCTSEGSGLLNTIDDLKAVCKGANIFTDALHVKGSQVSNSEKRITDWAKNVISK